MLFSVGNPDLSPMVLGTLSNMNIVWSTNQPDVVNIYNVFADAGKSNCLKFKCIIREL